MERTCVDRGGTFTDVVTVHPGGRVSLRKVRSDVAVVGELADGPLTFGTTVATNALLERTGVPTALVVTQGFADLVHIGDMSRPDLFDPHAHWPPPLCERVFEVSERLDAQGQVLAPLALPDAIDLQGIEAVAVVLLHSPRNPDHERAVAAWLEQQAPHCFVSLGHEVSAEVGYLSRIQTTLVDASITPVLRRALQRDRIRPGQRAMRSDGSLVDAAALRAPDAVLSGPAGGVVAVAAIAKQAGVSRAIGLDMGGTSSDVCLVQADQLPRREGDVTVAGVRLRRPMLEVDTVAAGGGSVLWTDGRRLGVGPRSAGADPGPQCYGRGGPPTVTDAALLAGLIDPLAFDPPLRPDQVSLPGGHPPEEFLEVARDAMASAIRTLAAQRGLDVQEHALVPFGGAAGQHACGVAERLGIDRVLIHPAASGLSAWGQLLARAEEHAVRPIWAPLGDAWSRVEQAWQIMEAELPALGELVRSVDLRHQGTDVSIEIEADAPDRAAAQFAEEHRRRYGFDRDQPITVVNARLRVRAPAVPLPAESAVPWSVPASGMAGPVRLDTPTTSVWVAPGWTATVEQGLLVLTWTARAPRPLPSQRTPHGVSLWASRFMGVANQAGMVLQRTARSVNIRERLDFSCAVFDGAGQLVANAPHIPVHLGAMGATVRDLMHQVPELKPDQHYLSNDPAAGGSHLPDLTVVHPVEHQGERFFVACRGHHVDVGGTTPGSMPPGSTRLAHEGFVVRNLPLLQTGQLRADLQTHLVGCRQLATVTADLEAQIASNVMAARLLRELGPPEQIAAWMQHLQDVAAEALADVVAQLPARATAKDELHGIPLAVALRHRDGRLVVDFTGTQGPSPGNLNAPPAVVRAATLYALRVLAGRALPLNEGALRGVDIVVPPGSLLDPPAGAAVAGGNVETSQRLVDLLLRAAGYLAASAGTMSNVTLGGHDWSLYETVGGGQGASSHGPGHSGRQIHMTNTRATDPEVLEARLPVRVRRFARRPHSGGPGQHPGGNGLIRELEVTRPGTAALLATRRQSGAPGLAGGHAGAPGADQLLRANASPEPWDGTPVRLQPGDRVRIVTPGGGGWGEPEG